MAHFKLYSVDVEEMWARIPDTFEYICGKKDNEESYTRFSGIFGGFDIFNIRCKESKDYRQAEWVIEELNKLYKNKNYKDKKELEPIVRKLREKSVDIIKKREKKEEVREVPQKPHWHPEIRTENAVYKLEEHLIEP